MGPEGTYGSRASTDTDDRAGARQYRVTRSTGDRRADADKKYRLLGSDLHHTGEGRHGFACDLRSWTDVLPVQCRGGREFVFLHGRQHLVARDGRKRGRRGRRCQHHVDWPEQLPKSGQRFRYRLCGLAGGLPGIACRGAGILVTTGYLPNSVSGPTLNICSFGAKTIIHRDGSGLGIGELAVGVEAYPLIFDGTSFELGYESVAAGPTGCLSVARTNSQPLFDINTACLPRLTGANPWTGANDFTVSPFLAIPAGTPSTSSAACTRGSIQYDGSFIYVCIASNTWKRAAIVTF